jgi:NADPH-ferrihemoprotein reductase
VNEEIQEAARVLGTRFSLVTAFSRPDQGRKAYVQDRVRENADEICDLMVNHDTYFYICGSANMAREVSSVVGLELRKRQQWDEEQLKIYADRQKKSKRWQQDVWG